MRLFHIGFGFLTRSPALLLSMTGHGETHLHADGLSIAVEIRTVNNRYFKLNLRLTEGYTPLESHVESLIRQQIHRGTVQASVQIDREPSPDDYRLNQQVLLGYLKQLESALGAQSPATPANSRRCLHSRRRPRASAELEELESQWPKINTSCTAPWLH